MPGTMDSVMFLRPWMAWPMTGSTPTMRTPGLTDLRYRPVPIRVPVVPMPATK